MVSTDKCSEVCIMVRTVKYSEVCIMVSISEIAAVGGVRAVHNLRRAKPPHCTASSAWAGTRLMVLLNVIYHAMFW